MLQSTEKKTKTRRSGIKTANVTIQTLDKRDLQGFFDHANVVLKDIEKAPNNQGWCGHGIIVKRFYETIEEE
jgi:hypothetical protein